MEMNEYPSAEKSVRPEQTPMPMIAGIMAIIAGAFKLIGLLAVAGAFMFIPVSTMYGGGMERAGALLVLLVIIIPLAVLGILSIVGGIYAIGRRRFGMALTGAIAALLPFSMLGIASVILVVLSKNEFE